MNTFTALSLWNNVVNNKKNVMELAATKSLPLLSYNLQEGVNVNNLQAISNFLQDWKNGIDEKIKELALS